MVEEKDVLDFLKENNGQASLDEVSKGLSIAKYGPDSAYAILQSLKARGMVDRKGEMWILTAAIQSVVSEKLEEKVAAVVREGKPTPDVDKIVKAMAKTLASAMKEAREPADEWKLATKPMTTEIVRKEKKLSSLVLRPSAAEEAKKTLTALPTGTFIDHLFFTPEGKPLKGLPIVGQFALTGLPGAGKSILTEEIAVNVSSAGKKVLYATAEDTWQSPTPRFDLQSRMKQKADFLEKDWNKIQENLFVLDTVMFPELRDWNTFAETYRYVVDKENIDLAIIDSVTVLESYRGALKYRVMELARHNQMKGVTCIYVNQRSKESWDTYEMAGGIGLAHNLDGTIIIDYGRVYWQDQQTDLEVKRGEFVRIARVLDCRMCNFKRDRIRIDITKEGLVRPIEPFPKPQNEK
ncbi:MAG: RAD55 family ATPase [Candidatus Bathyarchaeia archaeon]